VGIEFEEHVDVVLLHRQLLDPEAELLRDVAKRLLHPRPHVGVREDPPSLLAPDQMGRAVVGRLATRAPAPAGILSRIRTGTKGQDNGNLRPLYIPPARIRFPLKGRATSNGACCGNVFVGWHAYEVRPRIDIVAESQPSILNRLWRAGQS